MTVICSGNTGRTSAPHLHYELEQAGRTIDPLTYHGEEHRALQGPDLQHFQELVAQYEEILEAITLEDDSVDEEGAPAA